MRSSLACAVGALGYQACFTAFDAPPAGRHAYWGAVGAGCVCYALAFYFGRVRRDFHRSSMLHMGVHIFGNVGNLFLYDSLGVNAFGLSGAQPR